MSDERPTEDLANALETLRIHMPKALRAAYINGLTDASDPEFFSTEEKNENYWLESDTKATLDQFGDFLDELDV